MPQIEGMTILRGGAGVRYPKAMPLRRMVLEAWFALFAARRVWHFRSQAHVVVSILPPSLFVLFLDFLIRRRGYAGWPSSMTCKGFWRLKRRAWHVGRSFA